MKQVYRPFWVASKRCSGFTLVELVIAMGIFAVLAMLAYGGLRSVLDSQEHTTQHAQRLARIQIVYRLLEQDMQQLVKRGIRNEFGEQAEPLVAGTGVERKIEFTRGGWRNPAGQLRSSLQRVGYDLRDDRLIRESWTSLDRAPYGKAREQQLLDGLESLEMRFLDDKDKWHEEWPPLELVGTPANTGAQGQAPQGPELPRVIEYTMELKDLGTIKWLFQVVS